MSASLSIDIEIGRNNTLYVFEGGRTVLTISDVSGPIEIQDFRPRRKSRAKSKRTKP